MLSLERNTGSHTAATFNPGNGPRDGAAPLELPAVQTMWNQSILDASLNTDLD